MRRGTVKMAAKKLSVKKKRTFKKAVKQVSKKRKKLVVR